MSKHVFTLLTRFRFVEKTASEVGDGKAWPMVATLDQIAEVFHRVKDAEFISGTAYQATGDPLIAPEAGFAIHAPYTQPSSRAYALVNGDAVLRGYTSPTEDGASVISPENSTYLDAEYDRGDTVMYRDISDEEPGILIQGDAPGNILPYWNEKDNLLPPKTAFSIDSTSTDATEDSNFFRSGLTFWSAPVQPFVSITELPDVSASVVFSGEIAIVRANPADGFFAPTNLFYIGVKLYAMADPGTSDLEISTDLSDFSGTTYEACKYKIRLAGDVDIECPIYMEEWSVASGAGYNFRSGVDFVHEATEWWPYAKDVPPVAVRDSATGLIL